MDKVKLGSKTAKGGFANEKAICKKFNNWKKDKEAKEWLEIMGYYIDKINYLKAIQIPVRIKKSDASKYNVSEDEYDETIKFKKADVQIKVTIRIGEIIKVENISLKKANSNAGKNQVDKRHVEGYKAMWGFDDEITEWLKLFTGETNPASSELVKRELYNKLREQRRVFINEMPKRIQDKIVCFFTCNRILIITDTLMGRGGLSANWMLVTVLDKRSKKTTWGLYNINEAMNFYGKGEVKISIKGSLDIGKLHMQRKGGTPDPTKLQFYINPCQILKTI